MTLLNMSSEGTCFQWTPCIKWTLARVLRVSTYILMRLYSVEI